MQLIMLLALPDKQNHCNTAFIYRNDASSKRWHFVIRIVSHSQRHVVHMYACVARIRVGVEGSIEGFRI